MSTECLEEKLDKWSRHLLETYLVGRGFEVYDDESTESLRTAVRIDLEGGFDKLGEREEYLCQLCDHGARTVSSAERFLESDWYARWYPARLAD